MVKINNKKRSSYLKNSKRKMNYIAKLLDKVGKMTIEKKKREEERGRVAEVHKRLVAERNKRWTVVKAESVIKSFEDYLWWRKRNVFSSLYEDDLRERYEQSLCEFKKNLERFKEGHYPSLNKDIQALRHFLENK